MVDIIQGDDIMINVLIVAHEGMANGASYSLLNLMDALHEKCRFIVIVPYRVGSFIEELSRRNVKVYYVPFERWVKVKDSSFSKEKKNWYLKDNRKNQKLAKMMSKILENERIDIIHSNTSVVDFGYRMSKIMKVPHIWHIREFGEADFEMFPLCSKHHFFKVMKNQNFLICISNSVAEKYKKIIPKKYLRVIYNGVDSKNIIHNKKFSVNKNKKLICLQTGMIHKAKGQDVTIKAVNQLYDSGYKNIELWLAGRGDISSLGIDVHNKKWLKVLGQVDDMTAVRKKVDIEIVSSRKEAFGRVTVEAMMGKIPVIGTYSGGTKELIKENENGLFYQIGNVEELKEKILYFYNNRDEIKRMGENAYNDTKDFYQISRCANEVFALYKEILSNEE